MALELEYLDEAVSEAAGAAEWYAMRSAAAAVGFAAELDAAESAIQRRPNAWPAYDHGTRRYLRADIRLPSSIAWSPRGS